MRWLLVDMKAARSHLVREIFEIVLFFSRRNLKEMTQLIALQDSKGNKPLIQNMKHEALFCQRLNHAFLVVGIGCSVRNPEKRDSTGASIPPSTLEKLWCQG